MSRQVPYISKIPQGFKELIDAAQELKLFQVSENGPTQYIFKDEDGEKFRIQVGFIVSCSCSTLKINQQCIHTLFVLSKKFRVNQENPVIWQGSYTDQEIEDIINLKYATNRRGGAQQRQSFLQARSGTKKIDNAIKNSKQQLRQPIDEEAICPICQEDVKEDQPLTYCRKKCGNNYHIKCLRVWIDHKLSSGDKITCPMCRTDMTNGIFDDMRRDEDEFNVRYVTHFGKTCSGCNKKNILGNLYHCLVCENVDLCHYCFESTQHPIHSKFILKKKKDSEWEIAPQRTKKPSFLQQQNLKGLNSGLDQQLLSINHQSQSLLQSQYHHNGIDLKPKQIYGSIADYVVSCFSMFKDITQEQQLSSGLSIIGQEMNKNKNYCALCNSMDAYGMMRKLQCGHGIDAHCLKQLIQQNQMACPTCQIPILKGYISAFDLKPKKQNSNLSEVAQEDKINSTMKELDTNLQGNRKSSLIKGKNTFEKFKGSQSLKEGTDFSITGNLLLQSSNQINRLEITGERKNLNETDQLSAQDQTLQGTKKNTNFRITKSKTTVNKPPLNKPIKNDLNQRIREQKENLQQLIKQRDFQLVGREIFIKKDQNEVDDTIRGQTYGQFNKRNSVRQNNQIQNEEEAQYQERDYYNNVNEDQTEYKFSNYQEIYEDHDESYQNQEQNIQQRSLSNDEIYNKLNSHLNRACSNAQDQEEEETKENFCYNQTDLEECQVDIKEQKQKQMKIMKQSSTEIDDEDEEFQRQLIEQYEKQFSSAPIKQEQQETTHKENKEKYQNEQKDENIYHENNNSDHNIIYQQERSSSQYLTNQNTTDFSSANNINQLENEFLEDGNSNNFNSNGFDELTIRGNTLDRANSVNVKNRIQQQQIIKRNSLSKPINLNSKVRVSNSQKISQQRHGQTKQPQINTQLAFQVIGLSSKPQI